MKTTISQSPALQYQQTATPRKRFIYNGKTTTISP